MVRRLIVIILTLGLYIFVGGQFFLGLGRESIPGHKLSTPFSEAKCIARLLEGGWHLDGAALAGQVGQGVRWLETFVLKSDSKCIVDVSKGQLVDVVSKVFVNVLLSLFDLVIVKTQVGIIFRVLGGIHLAGSPWVAEYL